MGTGTKEDERLYSIGGRENGGGGDGEFEEFKDVGASAANADDVEHRGRSGEYEGISRM